MSREDVLAAIRGTTWALREENLAELLARAQAGVEARQGSPRPSAARRLSAAVVPVYGVLTARRSLLTEFLGGSTLDDIRAGLAEVATDPDIKTVILDVDSPGGEVSGVTELASAIRELRRSKTVIAVANHMMASAAYWLGAQATEIIASPSSMVGAIGIYMVHGDESGAYRNAGVVPTVVSAGKHKADTLPFAPLSTDGRDELQGVVDHFYALFTADVAVGRGVRPSEVRAGFGEGRAATAPVAVRERLVDRIGTFEDVVGQIVRAGIRSDSRGRVDLASYKARAAARVAPSAAPSRTSHGH